jgi:SAM-dependent methyltransferase
MPEDLKQCPLCEGQHSDPFDQRTFRGQWVYNRICRTCGLVYQSPRMSAEELEDFYERSYREVYQGTEGPTQKDLFVQNGRADALLDLLGGFVPSIDRYLDIGSSAGILLTRFQDHYQCQVVGVEPGEAYRSYAEIQGLTVYPALDELEPFEVRFDLISMAHVLEHLPDPVGYLENLRENHLSPSGWLLIEVPNLYAHDSFEIAHMTAFSAHTLRQVLTKAGYQVTVLRKHGQPRSELLPLYITLLAQPQIDNGGEYILKPERYVALKRRLGMLRRRVIQKLSPRRAWVPIR